MKIQAYKIPTFIKNDLSTVQAALIYGEDVGLTREYRGDILKALRVSDFDCIRLHVQQVESDSDSIVNAAASQSLWGDATGCQVVRIDEVSNTCAKAIKTFLNTVNDGFLLVVSGNLPASNPIRKLFEQAKNAAALPCYLDDDRSIRTLVSETLHSHNIRIAPDALQWVQSHMGADRMMTRMELEKLVLYAGEQKSLSLQAVRDCLVDSAEHRVDDVVYAVANGNGKALENGLKILLDEGISAVQILRMCQSHFINLHRAKTDIANGTPIDTATKSVFWKNKKAFTAQLNTWTPKNLTRALYVLGEAEKKCKQTGSVDFIVLSRAFYQVIGLKR